MPGDSSKSQVCCALLGGEFMITSMGVLRKERETVRELYEKLRISSHKVTRYQGPDEFQVLE